jgi:hypothetical protein
MQQTTLDRTLVVDIPVTEVANPLTKQAKTPRKATDFAQIVKLGRMGRWTSEPESREAQIDFPLNLEIQLMFR